MHGVQPPHRSEAMERPMQPVPREVCRQQHEAHLRRDRNVVRPKAGNGQAARVRQPGQRDYQRERQQQGQRRLHDGHEQRVGPDIACRRTPLRPVGQTQLVQRHQHGPDEHRRVRRAGHGPASARECGVDRESAPQHDRIRRGGDEPEHRRIGICGIHVIRSRRHRRRHRGGRGGPSHEKRRARSRSLRPAQRTSVVERQCPLPALRRTSCSRWSVRNTLIAGVCHGQRAVSPS